MSDLNKDMDMVTITRARFRETVKQCQKDFIACAPKAADEDVKALVALVMTITEGFCTGVEMVLFGDDEEDEDGDHKETV